MYINIFTVSVWGTTQVWCGRGGQREEKQIATSSSLFTHIYGFLIIESRVHALEIIEIIKIIY